MITYQEFLENIGIISEDDFNEVVESLPDTDIDLVSFDQYEDQDSLACSILGSFLINNYNSVYLYGIDFYRKELTLEDVNSLEDLEELKETLTGWTITNYDALKKILEERERENEKYRLINKKHKLLNSLAESLTLEQIQEIIEKYGNKK